MTWRTIHSAENTVMFPKLIVLLLSIGLSHSLEWWKIGPVYQVYPASFADSDGDGIGDIKGIKQHVDYFVDTGIKVIWLSPIYKSPMRDNGYDVSNYTDVNPMFGTVQDVEDLITTLHAKGLYLLLDFVPNHTSNESTWFQDSINKTNGKENFYIWKNAKGYNKTTKAPLPPNNWVSNFGGSAWTWNAEREQFYYHAFGSFQPDLNYTNPDVIEAIESAMQFWLDKGVDGFRMDAVPFLVETNYNKNEAAIKGCTPADTFDCQNHNYMENTAGTYTVVHTLDTMVATNYTNKAMFLEAYAALNKTMKYYGNVSSPFNFQIISDVTKSINASALDNIVVSYLDAVPDGKWPNWVLGNHDNSRVGTRMGEELIDAMNMIAQLLPGTSITFYGEEIGMTDGYVRDDEEKDTTGQDRDPERTPMQWNDTVNAGFSTNLTSPYLPANPNYWYLNVKNLSAETSPTHYSVYKQLVALHTELINSTASSLETKVISEWVWGFKRENYTVVINLDNLVSNVNLTGWDLPSTVYVKIPSINSGFTAGDKIVVNDTFNMRPRSAIVLSNNDTSDTTSSGLALNSGVLALLTTLLLSLVR